MRSLLRYLPFFVLAACLCPAPGVAGSHAAGSTYAAAATLASAVPDQDMVEAFTREAMWHFPNDGEGRTRVADRILIGFEAAPTRLVTPDGSSLRWGFKYQEGSIESVVIANSTGELKLLAAVDGMTRLRRRSTPPIDTMARYEQQQKRSGMEPKVTVFVHDPNDLVAYLPLLKRWLQADLLGFNADCGKADLTGACHLAGQVVIPARFFIIDPDGGLHGVEAPDVTASPVPLKSFVQ